MNNAQMPRGCFPPQTPGEWLFSSQMPRNGFVPLPRWEPAFLPYHAMKLALFPYHAEEPRYVDVNEFEKYLFVGNCDCLINEM